MATDVENLEKRLQSLSSDLVKTQRINNATMSLLIQRLKAGGGSTTDDDIKELSNTQGEDSVTVKLRTSSKVLSTVIPQATEFKAGVMSRSSIVKQKEMETKINDMITLEVIESDVYEDYSNILT